MHETVLRVFWLCESLVLAGLLVADALALFAMRTLWRGGSNSRSASRNRDFPRSVQARIAHPLPRLRPDTRS